MTAFAVCITLLLGQVQISVWGNVRDAVTGTPVVGAAVEVLDDGLVSLTDSAGSYALEGITAGARHLKISGFGYQSRTLHVFVPAEGAIRLDIALEPEPIPVNAIEVSSRSRSRGSESEVGAQLDERIGSRTVTQSAVRSHPGLAEPDFFEALAGGGVVLDPENPSGLHVNGGSSDQNLFVLDGIPVYSPFHTVGPFSALNPDAISRIELHTAVTPSTWDGALSAVVDARTVSPSTELYRFRGAVTATGARLTVDGPLPFDAGVLLSGRWGQPGFLAPAGEDTYVRGSISDGLVKLEVPTGGGRLDVLAFSSATTVRTSSAATSDGDEAAPEPVPTTGRRNLFAWESGSLGLSWSKAVGKRAAIDARVWRAQLDVDSDWWARDGLLTMSSGRTTYGARLMLVADGQASSSRLGVSAELERIAYTVLPADTSAELEEPLLRTGTAPQIFAAFAEHKRTLFAGIQVLLGLRGSLMQDGHPRLAPRVSLQWLASPSLSVNAGYARSHQWVHSLRNPESLIDKIFSSNLPFAAKDGNAPIAKSDLFSLGAEARTVFGLRVSVTGYLRSSDGLVLVAPATGQPFAVDGLSLGSARAWGGSIGAELIRARYRARLDYGFGAVTYAVGDEAYRPSFAVSHLLAASIGFHPTPTLLLRSAVRADFGRPTTLVEGPFEWEACSILEGGCEAAGSPQNIAGALGGDRLPAYVRFDIGVRKHWHARLLGREGLVAGFMTVSNILGRRNSLAYTVDPVTGQLSAVPMRPFSPLTVGLEWGF
ncbi:MAG: TonB-dependent receptor [Gemmatimonadetes bacterium]|nr:TonB-dependent receptor [Gemmatimonadota bacterium]NIO32882.1 TonB-dependent receptor [Gemmatimonadota bacterium]